MDPNIWGPSAWLFLHSVTFQYPDNPTDLEKENYYTFFNSVKEILPCPTCRVHYKENLKLLPIKLESRENLIEWLIDIHNEVNRKNGKKIYSYNDIYKKYNQLYTNKKTFDLKYIIIIMFLILILCYYKYKYK